MFEHTVCPKPKTQESFRVYITLCPNKIANEIRRTFVNIKTLIIITGRNSLYGNPFVIVKLAHPQDNKNIPLYQGTKGLYWGEFIQGFNYLLYNPGREGWNGIFAAVAPPFGFALKLETIREKLRGLMREKR